MLEQNKRIIILGGGYSVTDQGVEVNLLKDHGYVIGVNDSALLADCDIAVSMDRLWIDNRIDRLQEKGMTAYLRESAYRCNQKNRPKWPGLWLFDCDHEANELSNDPGTLNGFNSGVCAINLAYSLLPEEIFFFGFDMARTGPQPYWYPPYDWPQAKPEGNTGNKTYQVWSDRFKRIAAQLEEAKIKTYNVSPKSALSNFEKITYKEFLNKCAN